MNSDAEPGREAARTGPKRTNRLEPLSTAQHMTEETAQKLIAFLEASEPVKRLRASQILSAILGTIGFALFIVGVERAAADIPIISNAYGSIAVGLILLVTTGLLLRKLGSGE